MAHDRMVEIAGRFLDTVYGTPNGKGRVRGWSEEQWRKHLPELLETAFNAGRGLGPVVGDTIPDPTPPVERARQAVDAQPADRQDVWVVTEKPTGEGPRSYWTKVGRAVTNRDGSTTIRLDALPLQGVLQVRKAVP